MSVLHMHAVECVATYVKKKLRQREVVEFCTLPNTCISLIFQLVHIPLLVSLFWVSLSPVPFVQNSMMEVYLTGPVYWQHPKLPVTSRITLCHYTQCIHTFRPISKETLQNPVMSSFFLSFLVKGGDFFSLEPEDNLASSVLTVILKQTDQWL